MEEHAKSGTRRGQLMFVLPSFVTSSAVRALILIPNLTGFTFCCPFIMGKRRGQLSQAEIWDDSALLDSWNEALAEYKVYFLSCSHLSRS